VNNDELDIVLPVMLIFILMSMLPRGAIEEKGTLQGYVRRTDGEPIADALVALNGMTCVSGPDGAYSISNITPGLYTLSVTNAEQLGYQPKSISISISPGNNYQDIVLTPTAGTQKANLSGYVRDSSTLAPIEGAVVNLGAYTTTTNSYGIYSFLNVDPGTYIMGVSKTGYNSQSFEITLRSGDNTRDIFLESSTTPKASLTGTIREVSVLVPVSGAEVTLDGRSTTSDTFGRYSFYELEPGTYSISVSKEGFKTRTETLVLNSGLNIYDVALEREAVPQPEFVVSDLSISPTEVYVGETVEISATVTNVGDAPGTYTVNCDISPETYTPLAVPVPAVSVVEQVVNYMVLAALIFVIGKSMYDILRRS